MASGLCAELCERGSMICHSAAGMCSSILEVLKYVYTIPGQKYLDRLNLCHKWLMTGTHMPLQICRHNMT